MYAVEHPWKYIGETHMEGTYVIRQQMKLCMYEIRYESMLSKYRFDVTLQCFSLWLRVCIKRVYVDMIMCQNFSLYAYDWEKNASFDLLSSDLCY